MHAHQGHRLVNASHKDIYMHVIRSVLFLRLTLMRRLSLVLLLCIRFLLFLLPAPPSVLDKLLEAFSRCRRGTGQTLLPASGNNATGTQYKRIQCTYMIYATVAMHGLPPFVYGHP